MNRDEIITVLETLANGAGEDVLRQPGTVQALVAASSMLRRRAAASAGTRWTEEEDARLCSEHDAGMSVAQMALAHGRSSSAITLRLVKLGRVDAAAVKPRERGARVA